MNKVVRRILFLFAMYMAVAALSGLLFVAFAFISAYGKEWGQEAGKYLSADEGAWYRELRMPDSPNMSCCGAGDAYYADDSETVNGVFYAIITDTRPDSFTLNDGSKVSRVHMPVGTRVPVPPQKIRKHPVANPTDHTVVFLGGSPEDLYIFCYEPVAGN